VPKTSQAADNELVRLFDLSLDALCVAGLDGYLKVVNPAFTRILGYTREELLARPFMDNVYPDDREAVSGALAELASGKDIIGFECRQVCADGSVRWLEWNTHARPAEGVVYAVGRDVTERRATKDALRALRRVATLVAEDVEPDELFAVAAEEVARVVDVPLVSIVRYESDGTAMEYATYGRAGDVFPVGTRWSLEGTSVIGRVRETSRAARIDDYAGLEGEIADAVRKRGIRSRVGTPVIVAGRLWGAMVVSTTAEDPLPEGTEMRLADFTELLATAIKNAQTREAIARLADEQTALRRVATLVADEAAPDVIFESVAEEIARILMADRCAIGRFEADDSMTVVAYWSNEEPKVPVGTRIGLQDDGVTAAMRESRRPILIEDHEAFSGPLIDYARTLGSMPRSTVVAPIFVEGRIWGSIFASTMRVRIAEGTQSRVVDFAELVATAIANADSREALGRLIDEQTALRRVATLVAQGTQPTEVFSAVSEEVARLFRSQGTTIDLATAVRFDPGPEVVLVGASSITEELPVQARWEPTDLYVSTRVLRTGRSARIDESEVDSDGGPVGESLRRMGLLSQVGSPIVVEGNLWGAMTLNATEPLPPDAEERLEKFTALVATAIANAESRGAIARLADEQAALRRVATIAARESSPVEVLGAVAEEAAGMLETEAVGMLRFEPDDTATLVAQSQTPWDPPPLGTRFTLEGKNVVSAVRRTGEAARMDDWANASGSVAAMAHVLGVRSAVATPILVEGRLWGTMIAATSQTKPLPADTESRIGEFTELVATAISNAESREALRRLADEQVALRRVATLVAQGVRPVEIFGAVSEEVSGLFGAGAAVLRFEGDGPALVFVGTSKSIDIPMGTRWELQEGTASAEVYRTGRSARLDDVDWTSISGPVAEAGRRLGVVSYALSPIVVKGRLWGAMSVASYDELLPLDTEERLEKFTGLVATAIANAQSQSELAASRMRIVAASDEARRRIERDLHDGTQQRLVSLGLAVRATEDDVPADRPDLRKALSRIATELASTTENLQEISRGIHPAILAESGLGPALKTLARRSAVPVELDLRSEQRLPGPIEVACYYVVSEALTNAAKHARASVVLVEVEADDSAVELAIRDDGIGGANPSQGSGLLGLRDRVEALGGSLDLASPAARGTSLMVRIPILSDLSPTGKAESDKHLDAADSEAPH
jgi:PAS domain S-box-containing protein